MDAIFTLPYSEYETINVLKKKLKSGCSFYIPTSRQQKGIDFIIHDNKKNRHLRIQVKSSRSYVDEPHKRRDGRKTYKYNLWFNNFVERYTAGNADYYLLFGLYPEYDCVMNIKSKEAFWKSVILCFSEEEMFHLLQSIKNTRNHKPDSFFGISFDDPHQVFGSRGFIDNIDLSKFLLEKKLSEISEKLNV